MNESETDIFHTAWKALPFPRTGSIRSNAQTMFKEGLRLGTHKRLARPNKIIRRALDLIEHLEKTGSKEVTFLEEKKNTAAQIRRYFTDLEIENQTL